MSGQASLWGGETCEDLRRELESLNFGLVRHGLSVGEFDDASEAYANFTDNLPDPPLELVEAMIPAGDDPDVVAGQLDILDYDQDDPKKYEWHKYRTNYPEFAKPGGYTNRSLQTEALYVVRGITVIDDPKEFYHFHPNSSRRMREIHKERGWGHLPSEVDLLHSKLSRLHEAGAAVIKFTYQALEDTHPEIVPKHFGPDDVMASPLRFVLYHREKRQPNVFKHDPDKVLAGGHTDKAGFTAQMGESHIGLWLNDDDNLIDRDPEFAVVFAGLSFINENAYPDSKLKPGWHGVKNNPEACKGRKVHGKNAARTAGIFFANSIAAGTIMDKSKTHTHPTTPIIESGESEAVA